MSTAAGLRPSRESRAARVRRARQIDRLLTEAFPDAHCELDFANPFQLLIATVLSAQTTDRQVNTVTPVLFARYPDARHLAEADLADLETTVRPTGFFRQKARALRGIGSALLERFDGEVPASMDELVTMPGVGRKTANVVLGNAFAVPGFPVDTHVTRLANRLGWVDTRDPAAIESELTALFPDDLWTMASHRLVFQGRYVCHAKRPACDECAVVLLCPSAHKFGA
ncbi:MAG: endonuclease III [Bifidobacteriaceae bacterium]|jgi:endonuclease-3|nr:endonuclease III [Bifidobacteriaceae bacterium]